jgi:glycine hydroxymethyltransferase
LGYRIISGGTDNHLFLIDLKTKYGKLTGKLVEQLLQKCSIILNRNGIPFDKEPPTITSGIRIGTPAITTRGFKENEVEQVAHWIDDAIKHINDTAFPEKLKVKVENLCKQFPIYT